MWDEHDDIQLVLGFATSAETIEWILEKVRPIVAEEVKKLVMFKTKEDEDVHMLEDTQDLPTKESSTEGG